MVPSIFFRTLFWISWYAKRRHDSTWRELTSLGKLGPGVANPWRSTSWLFAEAEHADEALLRWKDRLRIRVRWFITSGIAFLLTLAPDFLGFVVYTMVTR